MSGRYEHPNYRYLYRIASGCRPCSFYCNCCNRVCSRCISGIEGWEQFDAPLTFYSSSSQPKAIICDGCLSCMPANQTTITSYGCVDCAERQSLWIQEERTQRLLDMRTILICAYQPPLHIFQAVQPLYIILRDFLWEDIPPLWSYEQSPADRRSWLDCRTLPFCLPCRPTAVAASKHGYMQKTNSRCIATLWKRQRRPWIYPPVYDSPVPMAELF